MLLRVSVSNHLSIHDPQVLLFKASSLRDHEEGLIECSAAPRGLVVPALVIYGANASGKSNLIHGIRTMLRMVLHSHTRGTAGGGVPRNAFKLDATSPEKPSRFEIDFVRDGVRHHYGFEASDAEFETEWLFAFPKGYRRLLFERNRDEYHFGRELRGRNRVIAELTRPNSLFVSAAAQNRHEQLSDVYSYLTSLNAFMSVSIPSAEAAAAFGHDGIDHRVIRFLERVNTGVCDYRTREVPLPEEILSLRRELFDLMSKRANVSFETDTEDQQVTVELGHRTRGGETAFLDLNLESAGTLRLLMVLSLAYSALDEGMPLMIDELDASLHTHATEAILRLFCSRETNPKGAQLIATTHDTNLLAVPVLRRDQLWFTEKDTYGATQLFPLTEVRTRSSDNFEKGYLQGRYGAVPFSDPLSTLGTPR